MTYVLVQHAYPVHDAVVAVGQPVNNCSTFPVTGGGVATDGRSTVDLIGCTLAANFAASFGGAVYTEGSSEVRLARWRRRRRVASWFRWLDASLVAFAFFLNDERIVLRRRLDCQVSLARCAAERNAAFSGGAIYAGDGSTATLAGGSTLAANTASNDGGALAADGAALVVARGVAMRENVAHTWGGGAISAIGKASFVLEVRVRGHVAPNHDLFDSCRSNQRELRASERRVSPYSRGRNVGTAVRADET